PRNAPGVGSSDQEPASAACGAPETKKRSSQPPGREDRLADARLAASFKVTVETEVPTHQGSLLPLYLLPCKPSHQPAGSIRSCANRDSDTRGCHGRSARLVGSVTRGSREEQAAG